MYNLWFLCDSGLEINLKMPYILPPDPRLSPFCFIIEKSYNVDICNLWFLNDLRSIFVGLLLDELNNAHTPTPLRNPRRPAFFICGMYFLDRHFLSFR